MGGSTRVCAWLLLLAMGGGPVAGTACEFDCLSAVSGLVALQLQSVVGTDGPGCHEAAAAAPHPQSEAVTTSPHAECSHEGASAPFVVATKLSNGVTADGSVDPASTFVKSLLSYTAAPPLRLQPTGAPGSLVAPLRI